MEYYIKGIKIKNNVKATIPEIYEMIFSIDDVYKRNLEIKSLIMCDSKLNKSFFDETLTKLQNDLESQMGNVLDQRSIAELKFNLISSWIADCPMNFV